MDCLFLFGVFGVAMDNLESLDILEGLDVLGGVGGLGC